MPVMYGSDNPDCVRVDHVDGAFPAHSSSSMWKKSLLTTALCLGEALVMFESGANPFSASPLTATNLASAATMITDYTTLMSGKEVLLRIKGKKANLCADDAGSTKADDSYITGQPCDPSNRNQHFIYDSTTYQFKSGKKNNLCMDDGGGWASFTWLRMSKCNSKSEDHRFKYDSRTLQFKNPSKGGYCMDDRGGDSAGASHYTIWSRSNRKENQRFEVLSQASLVEESKRRSSVQSLMGKIYPPHRWKGWSVCIRRRNDNSFHLLQPGSL